MTFVIFLINFPNSAKFQRHRPTFVFLSEFGTRGASFVRSTCPCGWSLDLVFSFRGCWGPFGTRNLFRQDHSPGGAVRGLGGFFPPSRGVRMGRSSLSPNIG